MSKLAWTLAATLGLGATAHADSLDMAAPAAKAEAVTISGSARGVAQEEEMILVVGATLGSVSLAQETPPAPAPTPTPAPGEVKPGEEPAMPPEAQGYVAEVTVTAQKRPEDVQEVPISVSTVGSTDYTAISAGGTDVRVLSARVPSLILESSFGRAFPRFYIRGLGNTDFDLNASQPVSMIVDDVVLENPVLKGKPLFDIERTEVLRGPQGTLFGRNTPAGIVKFDSRRPSQKRDGYARVSYGRYNNVDLQGAIGGPLSDTVSARASVLLQSQSDWIDNTFTGQKNALGGQRTWSGRLQLLWKPDDKFSALAKVDGWDLDGTARVFRAMARAGSPDVARREQSCEGRRSFEKHRNCARTDSRSGIARERASFHASSLLATRRHACRRTERARPIRAGTIGPIARSRSHRSPPSPARRPKASSSAGPIPTLTLPTCATISNS